MASKDTIKQKRDEAVRLVEDILRITQVAEENVVKSRELLKENLATYNAGKESNQNLTRLIGTTNRTIEKFRKDRDSVTRILKQVNEFHDKKYLPIFNQITDKSTGLSSVVKFATSSKTEILNLQEAAKKQYGEVRDYAIELRRKSKELNAIDVGLRKLSESLTTNQGKVDSSQKNILAVEKEVTKTVEKIESLQSKSHEREKRIAGLLISSEAALQDISKYRAEGTTLLADIREIYGLAAETGMSGDFDRGRANFKLLLNKWESRIFITSLVLLIFIVAMFVLQLWAYKWDLENHTFDVNFYIRFLITSPIIFYLYFCSTQYSQTRALYDKYTFKTTLAMSIKHHLELLANHDKFNTPERTNQILEFILEGFQKIYSEPYSADDYRVKLKLAKLQFEMEKRVTDTISKAVTAATSSVS
ncbi:hypothetical protein [Daejeonella lutea]|uniref:Uncharacterized protein n=1 Tax=Daejeonella lutea TaxID=572036 RepID=A0A1T5B0F6_9SPHI|nr:hypothetical protein [Daejeonella lutea]SKB40722.1 hypothetical protein SAMN05661099_1178 [Daejeonella lutea]